MDLEVREHLEKDIPYRVKWLNNSKVNTYIGNESGVETDLEKQKKWFEDYRNNSSKIFFTFSINHKPIGFMGFSSYSKINRNSDIFIMIGEEDYIGKGVGEYCMKWLIEYGFKKLNLNKITLSVFEDNIPAVSLYKKLGFIEEGKLNDDAFFDGKFHNTLLMAVFAGNN